MRRRRRGLGLEGRSPGQLLAGGYRRAIERIELRLDDIVERQRQLDGMRSDNAGNNEIRYEALGRQATELRQERDALEAQLPGLYEKLAALPSPLDWSQDTR